MEHDGTLTQDPLSWRNRPHGCPAEGMESVVATVSGYHGSERFNLIKMISYTGASYVGAMSRSITHLVCWKLEGRKFNLAKQFKTKIVNHRWLEECIKQGKRVPEGPYILQSGQSAGPLVVKVPLVKASVSTKNYIVPSESDVHICGNIEGQRINSRCSYDDAILRHSSLLDKNHFPDIGKCDDISYQPKRKLGKKVSFQEHLSNSSCRDHFQAPPLSRLIAIEQGSSSSLVFDERIIERGPEDATAKSSRRRRRLVKMNTGRNDKESIVWNLDPDSYDVGARIQTNRVIISSNHLDDGTDAEVVAISGTPDCDQLYDQRGLGRCSSEVVETTVDQSTSRDINLNIDNAPEVLARTSDGEFSNIDALQEKIEDQTMEHNASLATSAEVSCAICWTDFCSVRGVLPCGHRFCYSCIQNWADNMTSRRKVSTCPLCKASFLSITRVEDAATSDQKIYSQTIPCGVSQSDIFILPGEETLFDGAQSSGAAVCSACRGREPEELLMSCHLCQIRHIHSYCLDPPLLPWTCIHCKDLQTLYHRTH